MSRFDRSSEMDSVLLQIRELVAKGDIAEGQPENETRKDAILDVNAIRALSPNPSVKRTNLIEKEPEPEPRADVRIESSKPSLPAIDPAPMNFVEEAPEKETKSTIKKLMSWRKDKRENKGSDVEAILDDTLERRLGQVFVKPMAEETAPPPASEVAPKPKISAPEERLMSMRELGQKSEEPKAEVKEEAEPNPQPVAPASGFRRFGSLNTEEAAQEETPAQNPETAETLVQTTSEVSDLVEEEEAQIRRFIPDPEPQEVAKTPTEDENDSVIVPLAEVAAEKRKNLQIVETEEEVTNDASTLVTNFRDLRNGLPLESEPQENSVQNDVSADVEIQILKEDLAQEPIEEEIAPTFASRRETSTPKDEQAFVQSTETNETPLQQEDNVAQETELTPSEATISQEISKLLEAELVTKLGQDVTQAIRLLIREEIVAARSS